MLCILGQQRRASVDLVKPKACFARKGLDAGLNAMLQLSTRSLRHSLPCVRPPPHLCSPLDKHLTPLAHWFLYLHLLATLWDEIERRRRNANRSSVVSTVVVRQSSVVSFGGQTSPGLA
ncbi:hypothetical protein TcWFU_007547 [Taenia crassiceps]|uniref:Uncharacterized protein n=1 Tax=Taenia crassiceps TaxID=6207 RepID=A0ABR4Q0C1_9CEST